MRVDVVEGALATVSIFGSSRPAPASKNLVEQTQSVIAMVLYFAGMALSVFASAGLVSAMFEPGRIELLLSKPVSRVHLLLGRYAGNVLVVSCEYPLPGGGHLDRFRHQDGRLGRRIFAFEPLHYFCFLRPAGGDRAGWGALGQRRGGDYGHLCDHDSTPILAQRFTIERLLSSEWSRQVVRFLYYVASEDSDISVIIRRLILNEPVESWMPVWSTAIFGAVVLGFGAWRFQRRSF